jgi:hypothetical protein
MTAKKKKTGKKTTAKKTTGELRSSSTRFARQAADLKESGRALLRLATQLQRESEQVLGRSARKEKRATKKK